MDSLVEFVIGALTGVAGNAIYDQVKSILGSDLSPKLENVANNKEIFIDFFEVAMAANKNIKPQLEALQSGKVTNVGQMNNVFGDNFVGDKIVNLK